LSDEETFKKIMSSKENTCWFIMFLSDLPIKEKAYVIEVIEGNEEVIKQRSLWHTKYFQEYKHVDDIIITPREQHLGFFLHQTKVA